jgi:hypothetical protein
VDTYPPHLCEVWGFQGTKNYDWSSWLWHHVIFSSNYVILQSLIHILYNNYTTIHIHCPLLWYRLTGKILHLFTLVTFSSHPYLYYSVYKIVAEVGTQTENIRGCYWVKVPKLLYYTYILQPCFPWLWCTRVQKCLVSEKDTHLTAWWHCVLVPVDKHV